MGFNFGKKESFNATEFVLDCPFVFGVEENKFVSWFVVELYKKILTDCFHRAGGIAEKDKPAFWDNALSTLANKGLITLMAEAMKDKAKIFLVHKNNVVRLADEEERRQIERDELNESGVCLNFSGYNKSDILKLYARMLKNTLHTAHVGMSLSKALQIGVIDMRKLVADGDKEKAIVQGKAINEALKEGRSVVKDAGDVVSTTVFDPAPMEKSLEIIFGMISFLTGFNRAYISGVVTATNLSSTGEADELATERALAGYFHSIFKPCVDALFSIKVSFKSNNWRKLAAVRDLLPVLEATTLISDEKKQTFIEEALE